MERSPLPRPRRRRRRSRSGFVLLPFFRIPLRFGFSLLARRARLCRCLVRVRQCVCTREALAAKRKRCSPVECCNEKKSNISSNRDVAFDSRNHFRLPSFRASCSVAIFVSFLRAPPFRRTFFVRLFALAALVVVVAADAAAAVAVSLFHRFISSAWQIADRAQCEKVFPRECIVCGRSVWVCGRSAVVCRDG